jgi:FkbM family methyltransferase
MLDLTRHVHNDGQRIFLDIGANVGQTSLALAARFPTAKIHAFEPVTATFESLRGATAGHPNITCHRMGVSDHVGTIEFEAVPGSVYNTIAKSSNGRPGTPSEIAPVTKIDEFISELGVERIDALKTDTEGHDLNVLKGATVALARGVIRAVYTEVAFARANTQNTFFPLVQEFLEPLQFRFIGLYDMHWFQTKRWDQAFCNALFVRDDAMPAAPPGAQRATGQRAANDREGTGVEI